MKGVLIYIYTILYRLVHVRGAYMEFSRSRIWCLSVKALKDSRLILNNSSVKRTKVLMDGHGNIVKVLGTKMNRCEIRITGNANNVTINALCDIYDAVIVVNGNNCQITIGDSTTVGSMYMVCMGQNNYITIGKECMISDNVDIWATDSHPIYDENGDVCNQSRPIEIGNHVWLGKCSKILKGALIHDNAIIGMDALVTKEVPANSIYVGEKGGVIKKNVNWDRQFIAI